MSDQIESTIEDQILIKSAMRYIIIQSSRKQAIERATLNKFFKDSNNEIKRNKTAWILQETKKRLKSHFNLELIELPPRFYLKNNFERHEIFVDEDFSEILDKSPELQNLENDMMDADGEDPTSQPERAENNNIAVSYTPKTSSYRSYNQKAVDIPNIFGWNHKDMIEQSKVFIIKLVLAFIDLKMEPVHESEIFEFLSDLYFPETMRLDSVIDSNSRTIHQFITTDLPSRGYLLRERPKSSTQREEKSYVYTWGYRSEAEFSHKELLEFVRHFYGKSSGNEEFWTTYEMSADKADSLIQQKIQTSYDSSQNTL